MTTVEVARDDLDLDRDVWEMANLFPRDTGLPMTLWINMRGNARHDVRVKVCMTPGNRMNPDNLAVMSVRPQPELLHGQLSSADEALVKRWVVKNADVIVGYWNGDVSTVEMATRIQHV